MRKRIYLSPPHMTGEERKLVQEIFDANWIAPTGPDIDKFERELADYNQVDHCCALSSGTAAIHLALIMLGVQKGDEVACSSFTFSGSCNPIMYQQATPVFVDSERETWNIDPNILEDAIKERLRAGRKLKAIIAVHLYGMPAQMQQVLEVASRYDVPIIEDAAEGLGSSYMGKKLGSFGTVGIYSFNGNKIITTSGGGALVSQNIKWIQRAKFLSTQARDAAPHYQHSEIGYNYRLSNVLAGIGRGQLKAIDERVATRRAIFDRYVKHFSAIPQISFQPESSGSFSNRWLSCILIDKTSNVSPEQLRTTLELDNIESRPLWKPMHLQPVFKDAPAYLSGVSEDLFNTGLCLPSGSNLSEEEQTYICEKIAGVFNQKK